MKPWRSGGLPASIDRKQHRTTTASSLTDHKKLNFSHNVDARFRGDGAAAWLDKDNPHDETIVLHEWADAFGYAEPSVSNVTAVKEESKAYGPRHQPGPIAVGSDDQQLGRRPSGARGHVFAPQPTLCQIGQKRNISPRAGA